MYLRDKGFSKLRVFRFSDTSNICIVPHLFVAHMNTSRVLAIFPSYGMVIYKFIFHNKKPKCMTQELNHLLETPNGTCLNLKEFSSEKEAIKALRPHLDEILERNPYHRKRILSAEEREIFRLRLIIQQWFLCNHVESLIGVNTEIAESVTNDWVDDAETNASQAVTTGILIQNQTLLSKNRRALLRIENRQYGLDSEGFLIDLHRLWAVPHATQGIEDKLRVRRSNQN